MLPVKDLEASDMKRKYMNHIQDIVLRLQQGESERHIAQDMQIARGTVHKYSKVMKEKGYLEKLGAQPSESKLREALSTENSRIPATLVPDILATAV